MPRGKLPEPLREAASAAGNGNRYHNLPPNPSSEALGEPSDWLDPIELQNWAWAAREWWWLTEADRPLVEMFCKLRAKIIRDEYRGGDLTQLMAILVKVGGTPRDRSSVDLPRDPDDPDHVKKKKSLGKFIK